MDIVCIVDVGDNDQPDNLIHRAKALEEVKKASRTVNSAKLFTFPFELFEGFNLEETDELKPFYNADVVIVVMSIKMQCSSLLYHLDYRQHIGMNQNIILYNDLVHSYDELTLHLLPCDGYFTFISYKLADCGICSITNPSPSATESTESVAAKLENILKDAKIQSKVHIKETFLSALKTATEIYFGEELRKKLLKLRKLLKYPNVLTVDVLHNMVVAFSVVQDYDAMVELVENVQGIPDKRHFTQTPSLQYLYPFALNRSNKPGYREKALEVVQLSLEKNKIHTLDLICLCGRIYKDEFVESIFEDKTALQQAICWYRKGFKMQPNPYAGINLATLLIVAGNEFSNSKELLHIGLFLYNFIGKIGSLTFIKDYWTIATYFEINVLTENYSKAVTAAECMFKLKPSIWYYKSTIGNIQLICEFRKKGKGIIALEKDLILKAWIEYFIDATKTKQEINNDIRFSVIVLERLKVYLPCYVIVNYENEKKSILLSKQCTNCTTKDGEQMQDWLFHSSSIKSVSFCKIDERCLFLCVNKIYDSFQMYFPSSLHRQRFYDLVKTIIESDEEMTTNLSEDSPTELINFVYECDDAGKKKILGIGTFGVVYSALERNTKMLIAVKEILESNINFVDIQPLHEEIKLHSQLYHRNIVQYLGSISQGGFFKIVMEQVPESLSTLLRSKWGPLKRDEPVISFYTKQILEGLKYLHDQKIIHRDIKGDNILINTYSGVVKISDFGLSKRLSGLCTTTRNLVGTLLYMAPEVMDGEQSDYGTPADIWSLGCTVVEMANGELLPYKQLTSNAVQRRSSAVAAYNIHPDIPVELSYQAYCFILRCFNVDQNRRATATDLLKDLFIRRQKKT